MEQDERHRRYQDSPYSLEPNCKEAPGGLRDLQTILWIARAAGFGDSWEDLAQHGFITRKNNFNLLRSVGFPAASALPPAPACRPARGPPAVRLPDGARRTDGFRADRNPPGQRTADAAVLPNGEEGHAAQHDPAAEHRRRHIATGGSVATPINERFQNRTNCSMWSPKTSSRTARRRCSKLPADAAASDLQGMTARTLRALWHARTLIDDDSADPDNRACFLEILSSRAACCTNCGG
jgi:[protein-PII] uridylyltransferase